MLSMNRRKVLKTIAATGSVAAVPLSAQALSKAQSTSTQPALKADQIYVDVMLGQTKASQQSQIVNQSDQAITITELSPSSFKSVNGQVSVNLKTTELPVTLAPGESLPVVAEALSPYSVRSNIPVVPTVASENIQIKTTSITANSELAVSVFDCQFA